MTYDERYIDGTVITTADWQIYISSIGLAIVPQVGDIGSAGGLDYHVIAADPNKYDDQVNVVFIVQGRVAWTRRGIGFKTRPTAVHRSRICEKSG